MSTEIAVEQGPKKSDIEEGLITPFALLTSFVMVLCFWFIGHSWDASATANAAAASYRLGDENLTADRTKIVGGWSSVFRLVFASWGCFCFAIAPKSRLNTSTPFFWSLLLVAMFLVSSTLWSAKPSQTIFKLTVLFSVAIGAAGLAAKFSLREFLAIVACVCTSFSVLGILAEISTGNFRPGSNYRFVGTTHPNTEAIFASFLCLISRLYFSRLGTRNLWGFGIFFFGMAVVLMTKSRTALAGLLVSMLIAQTLIIRGANRLLLITGLLVLASLALAGSSMISRGSSGFLGKTANMGRSDESSTLSGRLPLWDELLVSINKKPILGHGYLAYWDSKQVEYLSERLGWEIPHGHNAYLDTLLDGGIVGFSLVLLAILLAFIQAGRLYAIRDRIEYAIVFGLLAYAVIHGLAESIFKLPGFGLFVVITCCFLMLKEPYKPKRR